MNKKNPTVLSACGVACSYCVYALPAMTPKETEEKGDKRQPARCRVSCRGCDRNTHAADHVASNSACQLPCFQLLVLLTRRREGNTNRLCEGFVANRETYVAEAVAIRNSCVILATRNFETSTESRNNRRGNRGKHPEGHQTQRSKGPKKFIAAAKVERVACVGKSTSVYFAFHTECERYSSNTLHPSP